MTVFTGQDIGHQALGGFIHHQRFAGQGPPLGLAQLLDTMLTGFEAVASDDFDAIALQPRNSLTAHVLDERGKLTSAIPHQFSRGMRFEVVEFVIDRDERGAHVVLLGLVGGAHRRLDAEDHLVHHVVNTGKQEVASVLLLRGALEPQIESISAQDTLE